MNTDRQGYGLNDRIVPAGLAEAGPGIVCTRDLRTEPATPTSSETSFPGSVFTRVHPWSNGSIGVEAWA